MDNSQLYMQFGELIAQAKAQKETLQEWRKESDQNSKEVEDTLKTLERKMDALDRKLNELTTWKPGVDSNLVQLNASSKRVEGILGQGFALFAILGTVVSLIAAGIWQLLVHWGDLSWLLGKK